MSGFTSDMRTDNHQDLTWHLKKQCPHPLSDLCAHWEGVLHLSSYEQWFISVFLTTNLSLLVSVSLITNWTHPVSGATEISRSISVPFVSFVLLLWKPSSPVVPDFCPAHFSTLLCLWSSSFGSCLQKLMPSLLESARLRSSKENFYQLGQKLFAQPGSWLSKVQFSLEVPLRSLKSMHKLGQQHFWDQPPAAEKQGEAGNPNMIN